MDKDNDKKETDFDAKPGTNSGKRPFKKGGPPSKRPRFDKNSGNVSYQKQSPPTSLMTSPRKNFYQLHITTKYFVEMCQLVYDVLAARDAKMRTDLCAEDLAYGSTIALLYRINRVAEMNGYAYPLYNSNLKRKAEGICLPDFICKCIESVGIIMPPGLATFAPRPISEAELRTDEFIHPAKLLRSIEARFNELRPNVTVPATDTEPERVIDPYADMTYDDTAISDAVFVRLALKMGRGIRTGVMFRHVNFTELTGRIEFVISRKDTDVGCIGIAPCQVENSIAELGAIYGFRNEADKAAWLGEESKYLSPLHASAPFDKALITIKRVTSGLSEST